MKTRKTVSQRFGVAGGAVLLATGFCSLNAAATGFVYQFNNVFSGAPPAGPAPWVDANFQDTTKGVLLTVDTLGLTADEFLSTLYLNLNPADSSKLNKLTFTLQSGTSGVSAPTIQTGSDAFKADGGGKYDILFSFATSNHGRLSAGDSITYLITGISGLTSADFQFLAAPSGAHGPFDAAAHVQGIMCVGDDSGWINPSAGTAPVPEPSSATFTLMAVGLLSARRLWLRRA